MTFKGESYYHQNHHVRDFKKGVGVRGRDPPPSKIHLYIHLYSKITKKKKKTS